MKDDGVVISPEIDLKNTKTLGLSLVTTLVEHQLRGSINMERERGTKFKIRFKELRYKRSI